MAEIQKYSLIDELKKADETLQGSPSLLGMTSLTLPSYVNSMRSTMFTSHLKQFVNLLNPQFPFMFTNMENTVGRLSSGYKKAEKEVEVIKKVAKFEDIIDEPRIYKIFTYDRKNHEYDVIERQVCKNLTENFGYDYINDEIDSLKEGDIIPEGDVLYRSTSYDEDMNYGYGRNVTVAYTLNPYTSEDAAIASRRICKEFTSIETDIIKIGLNGNDYLVDLYGKNGEYKPLPEIGEKVSNLLALVRRQFNNQLLFDFEDKTLRKKLDSDIPYYIDEEVEVIDYTIYDNRDEIVDNPFYSFINKYTESQDKYYQELLETCEWIMNSGEKYTREVEYTYKRAKDEVDRVKKWKESNDSIFSNMEIEVWIRREVPLAKGCKITGRYGNKSVISDIWEDEDMPRTEDGRQVDILLNLLAIVNRTTAAAIFELFLTGCAWQVRRKMATLETFEEKENMLFHFVRVLNEDQEAKMHKDYKKKKKKEKEEYIQDAIDNGIYIHQSPMWEKSPLFYRCLSLLKEFPFIKKDTCYIRKWGRDYKMLSKYFIGEMYLLKQFEALRSNTY